MPNIVLLQDAADRSKNKSDEAKKALKNLLRSGIPGIESMFAGPGQGPQTSKTEQSRGKFMKAVFGKEDGATIDTTTAAALLAATYRYEKHI